MIKLKTKSEKVKIKIFQSFQLSKFTRSPESHACKGVDEWLSGSGFRSTARNPESQEATAVRRWSFTIFIGIFIIISAAFMRQIMNFSKLYVGEKGFEVSVGLLIILSGLTFFIFAIINSAGLVKTLVLIGILVVGLSLAWQMRLPEEKIHVLEYGILGWLTMKDLVLVNKRIKSLVLAGVFCVAVGALDELFQAVLPYRVFEVRDIVANILGGIWGVTLYLLA